MSASNLVVRKSGWERLKTKDVARLLEVPAQIMNEKQVLQSISYSTSYFAGKDVTNAEIYGFSTRERFKLYETLLANMKESREWYVLIERTTNHTTHEYGPWIYAHYVPASEDVEWGAQWIGYSLDPLVFNFEWVDNTASGWVGEPGMGAYWGMKVPFENEDLDAEVYFFQPDSKKLIYSDSEGDIKLYGMSVEFAQPFHVFEVEQSMLGGVSGFDVAPLLTVALVISCVALLGLWIVLTGLAFRAHFL